MKNHQTWYVKYQMLEVKNKPHMKMLMDIHQH